MSEQPDLPGLASERNNEQIVAGSFVPDRSRLVRYKPKGNRFQIEAFGLCPDDRIAQDSVVRAIDLYVDTLDLNALGFRNTVCVETAGQPPYDPASLLKLYLYGYQYRVHSSRRLARECRLNIEVIWLMQEQTPEYRTINSFRSNNTKCLRRVHIEFLSLCHQLGLVGADRISVDGSHMKGNASAKSFVTKEGLERQRRRAAEKVEQWQERLQQQALKERDTPDDDAVDIEVLKKSLADAQDRVDSLAQQHQSLVDAGRKQQSRTDPDAVMLSKSGKSVRGYNVQIATDHQHFLIVGDEVTTDSSDQHQLHPLALQVKQRFGLTQLEAVADKGYYTGKALKGCLEDGITPYVAIPKTKGLKQGESRYKRSEFIYDAQQDGYVCPAGELLVPNGKPVVKPDQAPAIRYRNAPACRDCEKRNQCLTDKGVCRDVYRTEYEPLIEAHAERMQANPDVYEQRKAAVEHPFGTLKTRAGWTHFLLRGLDKVTGEWSLMALCYNFTRVLNILGMDRFKRICGQLARERSGLLALKRLLSGSLAADLRRFCRCAAKRVRETVLKITSATSLQGGVSPEIAPHLVAA